MTEEKTYREGDDETVTPPTEENVERSVTEDMPSPASVDAPGPVGVDMPKPVGTKETPALLAVLLVQRPDGILEATTNLPGIVTERTATLRDVRDMCHSMYCDLQASMVAKNTAGETLKSLHKAAQGSAQAQAQTPLSRIVTPDGR